MLEIGTAVDVETVEQVTCESGGQTLQLVIGELSDPIF